MIFITGCGRSGTKYTAALLCSLGLSIGHETLAADGAVAWYMFRTKSKRSLWRPGVYLSSFDTIFHQVRYPIDTISSMRQANISSWRYIGQFIRLRDSDSILLRAMKYWYHWNRMAEGMAEFTYRVEELPLTKLGQALGIAIPEEIPDISKTMNSRKGKYKPATWEDLEREDSELTDLIRVQAKRYGYKV